MQTKCYFVIKNKFDIYNTAKRKNSKILIKFCKEGDSMILDIENMTFAYKKNHMVIDNANLKIEENQVLALLGQNGAGKTTIFLLISGYLKLQTGTIRFNSKLIHSRKQISFVPETGGFFSSLTVFENLRFRYLLSELPEKLMQERISYLCDVFDLNENKNKVGKNLSHGTKKRLSLACAIVSKPKLLLLDEPTNGVDPVTKEVLRKIIIALKSNGTTIIVSSHDLPFVQDIADKITIIDHGKIILYGETSLSDFNLQSIYMEHLSEGSEVSYEEL